MASVLRCDEDPKQIIAWKVPLNTPEYGSQILVQESQNALLLESGVLVSKLEPGIYPLETPNFPFLNKLLPGGSNAFPYDVWFVTSVTSTDYKWGTKSPIQVFDSKYQVLVPIGCYGSVKLKIRDHESFFRQLVGTAGSFSSSDLRNYITPYIERQLSQLVSEKCADSDVFTLSRSIFDISKSCLEPLKDELRPQGISIDDFFVQSISVISDDPSFNGIKESLLEAASINIKSDAIRKNKDTYTLERSFDVLESASQNDSGSLGAFMGAGLGLGAGSQLAGNLNINPSNTPDDNSAPQTAIERLKSLKSMFELELISESEYNAKRSEILKEI